MSCFPCLISERVVCEYDTSLSSFCEIIQKSYLASDIFLEYAVTLFAPNNNAWEKYWEDTGETIDTISLDDMRKKVLIHVTNDGAFSDDDLSCGTQVSTFQGQSTKTVCNSNDRKSQRGNSQPYNRPPRLIRQIPVCSGFIQVINNVIIPDQ